MSRIYDNWERLVAAVLKKEQLWQLCHAQSRSPSISSESSDFSFGLGLTSSVDDVPFTVPNPASDQKEDDDIHGVKTASAIPSSILVKDQSPVVAVENLSPDKKATLTTLPPSRKRDLRIKVPKPQQIQHYGSFSPKMPSSPVQFPRLHPRTDDAKQQGHPLPLPPEAFSNSSPFFHPNSAATSPAVLLRSPESRKSPCTSWKRGKLIGKCAFGNVYLVFNSEKGTMCAMKEYNLHSDSAKSKQISRLFGKEIALLSSLKHPNIVPYYGAETVGDILYVYYEYVSGGSIYMILQEYGKLGESAIRSYTQQILAGLAYLHSKSITHGDIRGHTILVDPTGGVKLSNFGIEKQIARQFRPSLLMDSPYWMAPEVMMNPNARNNAIDIWSLGCTVIEMATSKPRFSQCDVGVAIFKVSNPRELPSIPDHLSDDGKDFLRRCLQWNPMHRATASQLLEHPFVKSSSPLAKKIRGIDRGPASSPSTAPKSNFQPSDIYTPRNISTHVLVGSPLPLPRLPQHLQTQISSPSESNMRSTPLIGGNGVIQYPYLKQPLSPLETFRNLPVHSPPFNGPSYLDPNILQGMNDSHPKQFVKASNGQISS